MGLVQTSPPAGAMTTNVQNVTATLPGNSTIHNMLIASVMFSATATITAPTGWVQGGIVQAQTRTLVCFYYEDNPGGLTSFQFSTTASAGGMSAIVTEWSGLTTASPVDKTANNNASGTTGMDSGTTGTTSQPIELWYAALGYAGGSTRTISGVTNGFTANKIADASSAGAAGAHLSDYYKITSAAGAANVGATLSSGTNWVGLIVCFLGTPVIQSPTDTAAGSESVAVGVTVPTDTASLTDSVAVVQQPMPTDAGTLAETVGLATIADAVSDTGAGTTNAPTVVKTTPTVGPTTALTVYGTTVASGTLATAGGLSSTSGGSTQGENTLIGTSTGYGEVYPLSTGGAWAGAGSIGAQSGHGWLWDVTTLEGMGFATDYWRPTLSLQCTVGSITADLYVRVSIYNAGSNTYTTVGTVSLLAQTISSKANYVFANQSLPIPFFNSGDKLYLDVWFNITANSTGSGSASIRMFSANAANTGSTQTQIITPGYGIQETAVTGTDPATLADSVALSTITPAATDTGAGVDVQVVGVVLPTDTGAGTDAASNNTSGPITSFNMGDTGAGLDALPYLIPTNPLTLAAQSINDTTLATANTLTSTIQGSGSPSNTSKTTLVGPGEGWSEIYSQGTALGWQGLTSMGGPSGNGWLFDSSSLVGKDLIPGEWWASLTVLCTNGSVIADIASNVYIYNSVSQVYTLLGTLLLPGQTITSSSPAWVLPDAIFSDWIFGSNDLIYLDLWVNVTVNKVSKASAAIKIIDYNANGGAAMTWYTPGYATALTQVANPDPASLAETVGLATITEAINDTSAGVDTQGFGTPILVSDTAAATDPVSLPTLTPALQDATLPDAIIFEMMGNIKNNGWDSHSELNGGLGGLWINWRYGTNPLATNFNSTGQPDAYPLAATPDVRHDPLTDVRYLQNLYRYKTRYPSDHTFDSEITKYTAIVKADYPTFVDKHGWLYDIFYEIYVASGDSWFSGACTSLVAWYYGQIQSNGLIYSVTTSQPYGTYDTANVLEYGCALIHAGTIFTGQSNAAAWVTAGYAIINYLWSYAFNSQWGVFTNNMYLVTNPDGTNNTDEAFGTGPNSGKQIKTDFHAQQIISLLHAYQATNDSTLLAKAQAMLVPLDKDSNPIGWWDSTNFGFYYRLIPTGLSYLSPGGLTVDNSIKEAGRQIQVLDALHLANLITGYTYRTMEQAMLQVVCNYAYYAPGKGIMYERAANWALYPNAGSSSGYEDWVTTEAMGIGLNGLLAFGTAPIELGNDVLGFATVAPAVSDPATLSDPVQLATIATALPGDPATGAEQGVVIGIPQSDSGAGSDQPILPTLVIGQTDLADGADQTTTFVSAPQIDSGGGTDSQAVAATFGQADPGAGSDQPTLAPVQPGLADLALGGEAYSQATVAIGQADPGAGSDQPTLPTVVIGQNDPASVTDQAALLVGIAQNDPGAGSDQQTLAPVQPGVPDSGVLAEGDSTLVVVGLGDPAQGSDAFTQDTAVGADQVSLAQIAVAASDNAALADQPNTFATLPLPGDPATGADQAAIFASVPQSDSGVGGDGTPTLATVAVGQSDGGGGADQGSVFATIPQSDSGVGQAEVIGISATVPISDAASEADFSTVLQRNDYGFGAEALIIPAHWQGPAIGAASSDLQAIATAIISGPILSTDTAPILVGATKQS